MKNLEQLRQELVEANKERKAAQVAWSVACSKCNCLEMEIYAAKQTDNGATAQEQ